MKHVILALIISAAPLNTAFAESPNVEKYKQVYIELITPILKKTVC